MVDIIRGIVLFVYANGAIYVCKVHAISMRCVLMTVLLGVVNDNIVISYPNDDRFDPLHDSEIGKSFLFDCAYNRLRGKKLKHVLF